MIIYADIESIIKKNNWMCKRSRIPCGYSMLTIWAFDHIENKHTLFRGKHCMKKFCETLREHAKKYYC